MEIIIVRHGACRENLEKRFVGLRDSPLDPIGEEQARNLAKKIPGVEHIYVSPLIRCRRTAELIWPGKKQTIISGLHETDFGPFEGKTHSELMDNELYIRWISNPNVPGIVPQVEDTETCRRRASEAFMALINGARVSRCMSVGVVTHGGTIMGIMSSFGRPGRDYYSVRIDNCGGYAVEVIEEGEGISLKVLESF